jgi:hypothetical protein
MGRWPKPLWQPSLSMPVVRLCWQTVTDIVIPCMQYPHCAACDSTSAVCRALSFDRLRAPSIVVTSWLPTVTIGRTRERTVTP